MFRAQLSKLSNVVINHMQLFVFSMRLIIFFTSVNISLRIFTEQTLGRKPYVQHRTHARFTGRAVYVQ